MYRSSAALGAYPNGAVGLSARGDVLRVVTTTRPPFRVDDTARSKALPAYRAVVLGERDGRLRTLGATDIATPARPLDVVRWFDDLLAVAPVVVPGKIIEIPNDDAGPLRLVDLADPAAPRDGATLDLPGDTIEMFPLGDGRLVGVGQPAERGMGKLSLEVSTLDVGDPTAPRQVDRVSWGHGEAYRKSVFTIGGRTLVFSDGWLYPDEPCPANVRCLAGPEQPLATGGVAVTEVGDDGRLSRAGWISGASGGVLRVGGRLAVVWGGNVTVVDPRTLEIVAATRVDR